MVGFSFKSERKMAIRALCSFLCCFLFVGLVIVFAQPVQASHEDTTYLADADGALDDDAHEQGIYLSMRENWISSWMMMTEQFVSNMMLQMLILGTFLDAEHQLEVQRTLQDMMAQTHKDFHTSFQMCQFGTNVQSLAAAERTGFENAKVFDQILASRERLSANLGSSGGISQDVTHRIKMFKNFYCDPNENNKNVALMCGAGGPMDRRTKDVDYARIIDNKFTLDANFLDTDETNEEKDIISLARNLYAGTTIDFMPEQFMNERVGMNIFMETRSLNAIRSVARYSFAKIVGMKAEGDEDTHYTVGPFMGNIILELGVPITEIIGVYGENPSYFAQMEVMTRKIYQSPEFYTNLYDKPANVRRIGVSLQAIELMQDRDRFEGALRREMLISLILELKLRKYQEDMNSVIFGAAGQKLGTPDL